MNRAAIIYCIRHKSGRVYIGSTNLTIEDRWANHRLRLASGTHNKYFQDAWDQSSEDDWEWNILETVPLHCQFTSEQYWLDAYESYKPENGFNISAIAGSFVPLTEDEYNERHAESIQRLDSIITDLEQRMPYRAVAKKYGISLGLVASLRKKYLPHLVAEDREKHKHRKQEQINVWLRNKKRRQRRMYIKDLLTETAMSYREIAKEAGCSLGLVGEIAKEFSSSERHRRKRQVQKNRRS